MESLEVCPSFVSEPFELKSENSRFGLFACVLLPPVFLLCS